MRVHSRMATMIVVLAMLLWPFAQGAQAASPSPDRASAQRAADWIAAQWDAGAVKGAGGIADAIIALSAAQAHPDTVEAMLSKLQEVGPGYADGNAGGTAKLAIAIQSAGKDPRTFLGTDLIAGVEAFVADGSGGVQSFFAPHLAAIALARAGVEVPQSLVETLQGTQEGGAFGYRIGGNHVADPDYTGLGIAAMRLIAEQDGPASTAAKASLDAAIAWAQDPANQRSDETGSYWATYSSANSTGMMASALHEAGVDMSSAIAYLEAQQQLTGGAAWASAHDGTTPNLMATTQAILAVTGHSYATAAMTPAAPEPSPSPEPTVEPSPEPSATSSPAPTGPTFTDADVRACVEAQHVFVIVDPRLGDQRWGGCATKFATGAEALVSAGFDIDDPSFIKVINGRRADYVRDGEWWTYFHRAFDPASGTWGDWEFSQLGASSYAPKPGTVEGWNVSPSSTWNGTPPRWEGYTDAPEPSPSPEPSVEPSAEPTPSPEPSQSPEPTAEPSEAPSLEPTPEPTPSPEPSAAPGDVPSAQPSDQPSMEPSAAPSPAPTTAPSPAPSPRPTVAPTAAPTTAPTSAPSTAPTVHPEPAKPTPSRPGLPSTGN